MQILNNIRFNLLGGLLLLICTSIAAEAADELRMGETGDILSGSRMIVVDDIYYYVDRRAPIHAPWTDSEFTLDQLRPGMNVSISILPASADNSLRHIKEIWIYLD